MRGEIKEVMYDSLRWSFLKSLLLIISSESAIKTAIKESELSRGSLYGEKIF